MANDTKKKPFFSRFKAAFVIIGIILIPVIMDQLNLDREDIKAVGRVCAGLSVVFTVYAVFTKMLRFFAIVILAVIAGAVLISEGIIQAPHVLN